MTVSVGSSHTRVTESPVQLATLTPVGGGGGTVEGKYLSNTQCYESFLSRCTLENQELQTCYSQDSTAHLSWVIHQINIVALDECVVEVSGGSDSERGDQTVCSITPIISC